MNLVWCKHTSLRYRRITMWLTEDKFQKIVWDGMGGEGRGLPHVEHAPWCMFCFLILTSTTKGTVTWGPSRDLFNKWSPHGAIQMAGLEKRLPGLLSVAKPVKKFIETVCFFFFFLIYFWNMFFIFFISKLNLYHLSGFVAVSVILTKVCS